jgi:hypothetical protein
MCPHDGDDSLHTSGSFANAAVLVYTHTDGCASNATEVRTLSRTDHKPIQRCSVYRSRSQMPMVRAMTITADSLLPRPKCGCDGNYDMVVKGLSVVVQTHAVVDIHSRQRRQFLYLQSKQLIPREKIYYYILVH